MSHFAPGFWLVGPDSRRQRRRPAFTLIELLVVMAIISLLVAMLLPSLQSSRAAARALLCTSNLRQFAIANQLYASDQSGQFVPIREGVTSWVSWNRNRFYRSILGQAPGSDFPDTMKCPDLADGAVGSAGMKRNFYGFNRSNAHGVGWSHWSLSLQMDHVDDPSETIQSVDGTDWHIDKGYADYFNNWDIYNDFRLWQVAYRHTESASVQYFDGHAEVLKKESLCPGPGLGTELGEIWNINRRAFPPDQADPGF